MPRDIVKAFQELSHQWLNDLKAYNETQLYHKPSNKEWSLAELYDHIMKVAQTYQIPNFYKCLNKSPEYGKPKNIKGYFVFNLNIIPCRKIKISSFPKDIQTNFTPETQERNELTTNFQNFVNDILTTADLLKTADLSVKHHHPFFGMISAREWFNLVEIHMRHHKHQKKRLENIRL